MPARFPAAGQGENTIDANLRIGAILGSMIGLLQINK